MRVRFQRPIIDIEVDLGWGWGRYEWPLPDTQARLREHGLADWMVRWFLVGPFRIERHNPAWGKKP